jgi:hypothetical protein
MQGAGPADEHRRPIGGPVSLGAHKIGDRPGSGRRARVSQTDRAGAGDMQYDRHRSQTRNLSSSKARSDSSDTSRTLPVGGGF